MRKHLRLYALLLTAFFMVGLMAAAAVAAPSAPSFSSDGGGTSKSNWGGAGYWFDSSSKTLTMTLGRTAKIKLTTSSATGWRTELDDDAKEIVSISPAGEASNAASSKTIDFTTKAAGSGTIKFIGVDSNKEEASETLKVVVEEGALPSFVGYASTNADAAENTSSPASTSDGTDIGVAYDNSNKGFFGGVNVFNKTKKVDNKDVQPNLADTMFKASVTFSNGLVQKFDSKTGIVTAEFRTSDKKAPAIDAKKSVGFANKAPANYTTGGSISDKYTVDISLDITMPDVTQDTDYELVLTATDLAGTVERSYPFTVLALPKITSDPAKEPKNKIVWGQEGWSFTPSGNDVIDYWTLGEAKNASGYNDTDHPSKVDAIEDENNSKYITGASLKKNAENGKTDLSTFFEKFDSDSGTIALKKAWKPGKDDASKILDNWNGKDVSKKVKLIAWRGTGTKKVSADKDFTLTFAGVAPTITMINASELENLEYDVGTPANSSTKNQPGTVSENNAFIVVEGPVETNGSLTVTSKDVPAGLSLMELAYQQNSSSTYTKLFDDGAEGATTRRVFYFNGTPTASTKGTKVTFTAENKFSKNSGKPTTATANVVIAATKVDFSKNTGIKNGSATEKPNDKALKTGDVLVGSKQDKAVLRAFPAPIKWSAKNLPKGVTLTPDAKDSTKATLAGTFTTPTKASDDKNRIYEIVATNTDFKVESSISADLMVWAKPDFKTKAGTTFNVKTGENGIKFSVAPAGLVDPKKWTVKVGSDNDAGILIKEGTPQKYGVKADTSDTSSTSVISIDMAQLVDKNVLAFIGSFDRVPQKDIDLEVTLGTPVENSTKTAKYKIHVTGTAPKFSNGDITFDNTGSGTQYAAYNVTAGDPKIKMEAVIDAKTMQKLTGDKNAKEIKLSSETDGITGLNFESKALKDGTLDQNTSENTEGKGYFGYRKDKNVAFKKLPVTVTAVNENINKNKPTTGKVSITIEGTAPSLKQGSTVLDAGATVEYKVPTKTALADTYKLTADGSGPLTITVKPEEKNGIKATINIKEKAITFSGTPADAKKDTVTKFSVEAKNASTGDSAKATVNFTAVPTPTLANKDVSPKAVTWGKNVKITPKLTATNSNVVWQLYKVSGDTNSGSGNTEADLEKSLTNTYGLTFDTAKGTITGAAKYATGKSDPLVVQLYASGDLAQSEKAEAKIVVLGEKVKVTTKSVTIDTNGTAVGEGDNLGTVSTNLSDTTDEHRANIEWKPGSLPTEVKGVKIEAETSTVSGNGGLTAKVSKVDNGTLKVTKKAAVPLTLTNYGTVSTAKLSVVVDGETPTIGDASVEVKAGGSKTTSLQASDVTKLSDKLKWKISTKPSVKGVSAAVKADSNGKATLTVKAGAKVTEASATVEVTVTDSVTKKTSEPKAIDITIKDIKEASDALDAVKELASTIETTEPEKKAEEKALGEGTVRIGAERGIGGLSAQQRAFIEDKGYVIAAVLPELEVEEASGPYEFVVDELEEAAATGAELAYFAFASKPTTDDEYVVFSDAEGDSEETKVIPESRKLIAEVWLNVGTKYAPVIAVKADAAEAQATTEEDVKAQAEALAEEKAAEGEASDAEPEVKEKAAE